MIKLTVVNQERQQFIVSGNEPFRIEQMLNGGSIIAHIYAGSEIIEDQEPCLVFDGTLGFNNSLISLNEFERVFDHVHIDANYSYENVLAGRALWVLK